MSVTARSLRNEADYLPNDLKELVQLRADVIAAGHSRRVADGICSWLLAKAAGEPDGIASDTRARYRRILSELAGQPPNAPGSGKPPIILVAGVMSSPEDEWVDRLRRSSDGARRGRRRRRWLSADPA